MRAFFPFGLRRFVTADVEAVVREQCADFCQKLFDKLECFVLTGAENFLKNAAKLAQLRFFTKAAQMRVCRNHRSGVARHIDFRDDLHAAHAGIFDNAPDLLLRVIRAGRFVQQRQRFALDAPALVVYKMPVQNIQLHTRHLVDDLFHFVRRKEMTGAVKRQAAMTVVRCVFNVDDWQRFAFCCELRDSRQRPHGAAFVRRFHGDAILCNGQLIALFFDIGLFQRDKPVFGGLHVAVQSCSKCLKAPRCKITERNSDGLRQLYTALLHVHRSARRGNKIQHKQDSFLRANE